MAVTKKTNVIIPEIMGPAIGARLDKALRLMPYAAIDNTLEGREGDEVTIPVWDYAGDAVEVAEGEEVPTSDLACTVRKYKVKKAMKAFPLTDEAAESGFADPGAEAERQILMSIKGKVEQDLIDACYGGNVLTVEHNGALDYTAIVRAVAAFNFESNPDKVLFINPAQEESLLLNPYFLDKTKYGEPVGIEGVIGKIAGCWVKKSKRIEYVEPTSQHGGYWRNIIVLVQNEKLDDEDPTAALTIFSKKGITLETQRDALNQTEAIVGSKHYIATLTNSRKVIISKNIVAPALPFTLSYNANGGSGEMESQTAPGGSTLTVAANTFEKEGLVHCKWNTLPDGTGTDYAAGETITMTQDLTLYAIWGYEISFNANGGTGSMDSLKVVAGESTSLPENTLTDSPYSFLRWNTAADGSGTDYADGASVTPAAAMTLYAIFGSVVTVDKNDDNATGGVTLTVRKGGSVNIYTDIIQPGEFALTGYTVFQFTDTADGKNATVTLQDSGTWTPTGSLTLYTLWRGTVVMNKNNPDATGNMPNDHFTRGNNAAQTAVALRENSFSLAGHEFVEWNTAADGSGTSYPGSRPGVPTYILRADLTCSPFNLYAQWTPVRTLSYNANGGSGAVASQTVADGGSLTVAANAFTRSGYTFSKWNTAADGSGTDYAGGDSITMDADVTLYAIWAAETPSADPFAGKSFTLYDDGTYVSAVFDSNGQYQMQISEDGTTWMAVFAATSYTVVNNTVEIEVGGPEPVTASLDGNGDLTFLAGESTITMTADSTPKSILPYTEPEGEPEGE